jgi:hypothetical protein
MLEVLEALRPGFLARREAHLRAWDALVEAMDRSPGPLPMPQSPDEAAAIARAIWGKS